MRSAKALAGALDAREELLGRDGDVHRFIAAPSGSYRTCRSFQWCRSRRNKPAAARAGRRALGVSDEGMQVLFGHLALGLFLLIDEVSQLGDIAVAVQQQAVRRQAVAPGAADLLVIAFDALGQVVMHDKAHVGLVDAHAKGDRGHDDLHIVADEQLLVLLARRHPPARRDRDAPNSPCVARIGGQLVHLLAREAVDDPGLVRETLQKLQRLAPGSLLGTTSMNRFSRLKLAMNSLAS